MKKKKPDAFAQSQRHVFNGVKLEPWTEARRIASQSLGMIYPSLSASDWASVKRGGAYPGAVRDVMLTLWICTIPSQDLLKTEAAGIENAMTESMAFGIKHGIQDLGKQPFWDAMSKCMDIWNEVNASVTIPDRSGDEDDSGND